MAKYEIGTVVKYRALPNPALDEGQYDPTNAAIRILSGHWSIAGQQRLLDNETFEVIVIDNPDFEVLGVL